MLGTPTSQVSVISRGGSLNAPFLFKNFKKDYPHSRLRLAIFYFPKCLTPGQEHLSELAIMPDPLNTFDVMDWLKKGGNTL